MNHQQQSRAEGGVGQTKKLPVFLIRLEVQQSTKNNEEKEASSTINKW